MTDRDLPDIDALLAQARRERPAVPEPVQARILAQAEAEQARLLRMPRRPAVPLWQRLLDGIGGWPVMGGMATACAAGIWIGLAPPQILPDPVQLVQLSQADLFGGEDLMIALSED